MQCRLACLVILAGLLSGCVGDRAFQAVPEELVLDAEIPGHGTIRSWGDKAPADSTDQIATFKRQIAQRIAKEGKRPNGGRIDILLLSGGGSDGAFGAGLLAGWSKRGDRPEFALVTGISTGALIAPFAFLGPDYDEDLEKFYTDTKTDDVLIPRIWGALTGDLLGFADTTLLSATLERTVTPEFVELIAAEHNKGRRLLVGTTNLDAQRPVVWNIGEIAASDVPGKHRLITEYL